MILIFRGTHRVLSAEKQLKKSGVAIRLIPVPRRLTSDCGLAIRIPPAERRHARDVLTDANLLPEAAYILHKAGNYEPIPF